MTAARPGRPARRCLVATALLLLVMTPVAAGNAAELEALCEGVIAGNVWDNDGNGSSRKTTFYYAPSQGDYHPVGVTADQRERGERSSDLCLVKDLSGRALALPVRYERVWWDRKSGATRDGSVWSPVCPHPYAAVGVMVQSSYRMPPLDALRCVREDLTVLAADGEEVYKDAGSRGIEDLGVWKIAVRKGVDGVDGFNALDARDAFVALGAVYAARSHSPPEEKENKIRLIRKSAIRLAQLRPTER